MKNIINYSKVITIRKDWHNANSYKPYNYYPYFPSYNWCNYYCYPYISMTPYTYNSPYWCCNNFHYNDIIIEYVFKEQTYYIRLINNQLQLNWLSINTGTSSYINLQNSSYSSINLITNLFTAKPVREIPVIYPDYSKVDVGKGIQWSTKVFAPFVDTTAWPTYDIVENYNKYGLKFYNLGFVVSRSYTECQPSWATYYLPNDAPINAQIKKLRELGGDICVSFGGAAGEPLHILAPDVDTIFNQYKLFCDAYGLTRIDFDLEGYWISQTYANQNTNNANALKKLQDYYKSKGEKMSISITLPILPSGLNTDGLRIVQQAIDAGVDITCVNAMTMDYGDSAAPNPAGKMGQYGIQAITSLKNNLNTLYKGRKTEEELWAMIGTTPMLGVNDVVTEIFAQPDANQTLSFAQSKNINMISMWSANRDLAGTPVTKIPQNPNDFTNIFKVYTTH